MKYLFIAFLFISSFISGQGIEPTSLQPTQYQGGILRGVIPYVDEFTGETLYIYQHVDSLVFIKDSIYVRNDSIFLRDGTGFAIVTDSIYVVTGATKDTIRLRDGSGFALVDKALVNGVTGTGTATRVAFWNSSSSLSSDADLYWDNSNKYLGVNTSTPAAPLDVTKGLFSLPVARFENTGTNGRTVTIKHGASSDGRYTLVLENGSSMNTYFDTRGYLGLGVSPSYPLHVYGSTGISRFQNTTTNGDSGFDLINPNKFYRVSMNADGGASNDLHFRDVTGGKYPITLKSSNGFVGINNTSPSYQMHVNGSGYLSNMLYVGDRTGTANAIAGWASDAQAVNVGVGSGLGLSSGILTNTGVLTEVDGSTTNELQTISTNGNPGNISINGGGGTLNLNVNDADASTTNELQNLSFATKSGSDIPLNISSATGVNFRDGTGISLSRTASNVLTINSTITDTDAQTLSWSSPNISISGGNSIALPVLPTGSTPGNGLRWTGSEWEASTLIGIAANGATTKYFNWNGGNSYLSSSGITTGGNLHFVAGGSGVSASRLIGQDAADALTGITLGSGLGLSSGTLSVTNISGTTNYIPKFATSSTLNNSIIYFNGEGIGINNTSFSEMFNVKHATLSSTAKIENTATSGGRGLTVSHAASTDFRYTLVLENGSSMNTYFDTRGYLGLGVSPSYPLHVYGSTGISRFQNTSSNGESGFDLVNPSNFWRIAMNAEGGVTNNVHFRDVTGGRYPLTLKQSNGFVGVNNTNPSYQLDVSGSGYLSSMLYVADRSGTASAIAGWASDAQAVSVGIGSGLSLSGGTLTATDASTSNEIQTLSHSAPTLSISSGNSITLTQQYGQMSSNGGCATVSTSYGTTVSGTAIGNNVTVSSTTITVPATGTYELNYSGYFILDPTASNVGVGMRVRKNGSSTVSVTIENIQGTASTEYRAMSKNVIVSLNSGDTLVLQPTKDAGTVNLCDYVMNIIRLN